MNALTIFQAEQELYQKLDFRGRFVYWALKLVGSEYVWGAERIGSTDCSGAICFPFLMMDYDIRVTAQVLRNQLFTRPATPSTLDEVVAVFFTTNVAMKHGEKTVPPGTVVHVAPLVGQGVVMDASWPIVRIKTFDAIIAERIGRDQTGTCAALDITALEKMSASKQYRWGVDSAINLFKGE